MRGFLRSGAAAAGGGGGLSSRAPFFVEKSRVWVNKSGGGFVAGFVGLGFDCSGGRDVTVIYFEANVAGLLGGNWVRWIVGGMG